MKRIFTCITVLVLGVAAAWAYDFSVVHEGQTLYFNILPDTEVPEVEVISEKGGTNNYTVKPEGAIMIPDFVTHNDQSYKVTAVGKYAFYSCPKITSVVVGNEVTTIDERAFSNCSGMTSLVLGEKVENFGYDAFYYCSALLDIEVLNSVCTGLTKTTFAGSAWEGQYQEGDIMYLGTTVLGCKFPKETPGHVSSINSIDLHEGITHVAANAFERVSIRNTGGSSYYYPLDGVMYITIPRSVTHIGVNAFSGCTKLPVVTIPEQVQEVGAGAFAECSALKTVTWLAEDCRLSAKIFPPKLDKIEFGKTIRTVPAHICEENTALTSVAIPHSVETIGEKAFFLCTDLYQVAIGAGVTTLGDRAFYGCTDLTNITCYTMTPPAATPYCFLDVPITASVKVPCGTVPLYEAAPEWEYFWSFTEIIAYTATAYSANEEWGTVSVDQTCAEATFRAEPVVGCKFLRWSDGDTQNPRVIPLSDHVELVAEFAAEATGIESVWDDGTEVYADGNTILIRNTDLQATVYDTTGRRIYCGFLREIALDRGGVYIVEIGGKRMKVVISG